jgi:UDP-N-acetylmuramyl pentapeptide phosphotransferase/UDP-N-acetylglucosamine-1-phosphate transferase
MTVDWLGGVFNYPGTLLSRLTTDSLKYIGAFLGSLSLSLLLTPLVREAARKAGMVDMPGGRRINKTPVPRGGGLAVFLSFHLMLLILFWLLDGDLGSQFTVSWHKHFLLASGLLVVVGLVDDKRGIKPWVKLCGQIAAALVLYMSGVHVGGLFVAFPAWLDCLATVVWIVMAVNAFNLIDGMDGLASGLALIACVGLAGALLFMGRSAATLPYLVLAGACLGFLRYNFHPASVFLGDTGSMFLGLCVATMPLMTGTRKELATSLIMPLLAMGVPIFDTLLAIWRRSVRAMLPSRMHGFRSRFRVMQPDKDHLHHRLLRETMNQRTAAVILYVLSAALVAVGLGGTLLKARAPGLFLIAFIVAIFVVVRHLARVELWDTGRLIVHKRSTIRLGILMPVYMAYDVICLCIVWIFARWETGMPINRAELIADLPVFVVPVFVMLVASKTYWRVWSRAQIRDFTVLGLAVLSGAGIGAGLAWLFNENDPGMVRFILIYSTFAFVPIAGIRIWRDSVRGLMQAVERRALMDKPGVTRALAYGGGLRFRALLREMAEKSGYNDRVILGIIDDDINLRGRIVAGYKVLGVLEELPELVRVHRIDSFVITCETTEEKQREVAEQARALGLKVSLWAYYESSL